MSNDLAKRAVACKRWRWLPGMLGKHPNWREYRVAHVRRTGMRGACRYSSPMGGVEWGVVPLPTSSDVLPDFSDPATLGCLLALVREARGDSTYLPTCLQGPPDEAWVVDPPSRLRKTWYDSEVAALVAALEAAP